MASGESERNSYGSFADVMIKSILEKMLRLASPTEKSRMWGLGYRLGTEARSRGWQHQAVALNFLCCVPLHFVTPPVLPDAFNVNM